MTRFRLALIYACVFLLAGARAATSQSSAAVERRVNALLSRMTLEEKVGQLFIQNVYGKDATTPDSRNLPLYGGASPAEGVQKYHLGGVIYFAWTDSVQNPDQIVGLSNGLQKAALTQQGKVRIPLQVAIDQEQGVVTRIGPPAGILITCFFICTVVLISGI